MVSEQDGAETEKDTDWMKFIVFIQSKGNMRRDEILLSPLLLLNSIHSELVQISANDIANSMGSSLLGTLGSGSPQPKTDSRMGKMPEFTTRDEYFDFINNIRGR